MSGIIGQIKALLALNAKGAVSHPVPGMAVELLERAADALEARDKTIAELVAALEKSAQRNRYDGDLFHDQGLDNRMEASWSAWEDASKLLYRLSQAQSKDKAE